MKLIRISCLLVGLILNTYASAAVCHISGKVSSIIPSRGDVGLKMDVPLTGCTCNDEAIWIDDETEGGMAMYSAALSSKIANKAITVTIEDGKGQGAVGNDSVTYRFWASCQLVALEIL